MNLVRASSILAVGTSDYHLININYQLLRLQNNLNYKTMKNLGTNAQGNTQIQFEGTLLSIGTTELKNSNEKKYKIVNIEFADVNGVAQKSSAACYEGNYSKGIEVGKNYLCTATIVGNEVYIQMSHLEPNAGRASVSAFLAEAKDAAPIKVGVLNS